MKTPTLSVLLLAALPLIAACSESTSGDPGAREDYNELIGDYNAMADRLDGARQVTAANLRDTGRASYDGYFGLTAGSNTNIVGEADIQVNFAEDDVDVAFDDIHGRANGGTIQQWTHVPGDRLDAAGGINVADANNNLINTQIGGAIRSADGRDTIRINGDLNGNFVNAPTAGAIPRGIFLDLQPGSTVRVNDTLNVVGLFDADGSCNSACMGVVAERD